MDVDGGVQGASAVPTHKAHVELPSQEEIEIAILDQKKKELMAKFAM